ncbi:YgiW/YdeI family stress tolerance OB fold protein [Entomohabitans teleogrylli]|uniref:YgiW/YdeI family stress tolerance OB fold protein n=1 Tax=Entomohabitans teleogrylli TaxID=1384589 RepID=UPI00073DAA77|nr:NirD/YgiW/YdeI family stress tolerance protein [Entomohabitans teleogrylli]
MKQTALAILVGAALCAAPALAQKGGFSGPDSRSAQGGFVGPSANASNVAQAKTLRDDSWVALEGNITQKVGKERYEFRDSSGTIVVEIDDHIWGGVTVTPTDKVRIEGEVDKDWNSVEIDVKSLRKLP